MAEHQQEDFSEIGDIEQLEIIIQYAESKPLDSKYIRALSIMMENLADTKNLEIHDEDDFSDIGYYYQLKSIISHATLGNLLEPKHINALKSLLKENIAIIQETEEISEILKL